MRTLGICLALSFFCNCQCGGPRLRAALPPGVRIDTYEQQAASQIDVLWVVDNSGSMAPRQENLGRNFHAFIKEFARNAVDFRIAVTTTDIFKEAGRFVGAPQIISPQTPNLLEAFSANIKVGISGSPYEAGLEAAKMAIDRQSAANSDLIAPCTAACGASDSRCIASCREAAGFQFLRPEAYLYAIFVSDEEDRSSPEAKYYQRYFETAKDPGNDAMVTAAAIAGDANASDCDATWGRRYAEVASLTGGVVGSICDNNFSATLTKLASNAVGLNQKFALQIRPNVETVNVRVYYPCHIDSSHMSACVSQNRDACVGVSGDSVELECLVARGSENGWTYEPELNVVAFSGDAVPTRQAIIEIEYYEEGKSP